MTQYLFMGGDDLVFRLPTDRTVPPVQQYSGDAASGAEARGTEGALSWLATFWSDDYQHGSAVVNIAVCNRRDPVVESDRLLEVADLSWPMVKFACRAGRPDDDLAVKDGQWFVLTGLSATNGGFGWYRVLSGSEVIAAGTPDVDGTVLPVASRWVSVFGRDWLFTAPQTQVGIMDGVVAVYERTVRLNSSGI
jgi:hypothetical protein